MPYSTKEKKREYDKKYRELNKAKRAECDRRYREENKDKKEEYYKKYTEEHKEQKREYDKRYRELNKEKKSEQNRKYRKNARIKCREYLGGKCVKCGTTHNLQFDHIKRDTKKYEITPKLSYKFDYLKEELNKCQLLCVDCHKIKTKSEWIK